MTKGKKVQFIFTDSRTFVEQDYRILTGHLDVDRYQFVNSKNPIIFIFEFIKQFFNLIIKGWKYDIFFIWFADYHSFLPTLFSKIAGKKSILVIGGYDVCRIPQLKYGVFYKKYRGFFAIQSIQNCTINLTVSNYVDRKIKFISPKSARQLIYNCIEFNAPALSGLYKEDLIITVGNINNEQTFYRKGIDTFIEVARMLPKLNFQIIGIDKINLSKFLFNIPKNLSLIEQVNHNDLIDFYQKAKIYCQFSRMDTFCLTLAEAMYFDCIPVITHEGGMPEVIGEKGYIVPRKIELIAEILSSLIEFPPDTKYKEYVINKFQFENRKKSIIQTISNL